MTRTRRRTTVHDLAALRVHPDGTRVQNSDSNRSARRAKYAVRDVRGNWIAHDAGGLGTVRQRRSASQPDDDAEDVPEREEADEGPEEAAAARRREKGKGRAQDSSEEEEIEVPLDSRTVKRRRFNEDMSFLTPRDSPAYATPAPDEQPFSEAYGLNAMPVPSADLLKSLHYFASSYYTAMGQLYDATREHRKKRKIRRAEKLKRAQSASSSRSESAEQVEFSGEEGAEDEGEDGGGDEGENKKSTRRPRKRLGPMEKDMYKIFDGSALMALGMLFQEHVAEVLNPQVPEGWEKEMAATERLRKAEARNSRKARQMRGRRGDAGKSESPAGDETEVDGDDSVKGQGHDDDDDSDEDEYEPGSPKQESQSERASDVGSSSGDES